jgi:hypothetical protein
MSVRAGVCLSRRFVRTWTTGLQPTHESLFQSGQIAIPAVCCHPPDPEAAPDLHKFSPVSDSGAVRLLNRYCVTPNFDGDIARLLDSNGLQTKILIAGLTEFPQHQLDRVWSLYRIALWGHQKTICREQSGSVILISGIESSNVILREFANGRLHVQPGIDASGITR